MIVTALEFWFYNTCLCKKKHFRLLGCQISTPHSSAGPVNLGVWTHTPGLKEASLVFPVLGDKMDSNLGIQIPTWYTCVGDHSFAIKYIFCPINLLQKKNNLLFSLNEFRKNENIGIFSMLLAWHLWSQDSSADDQQGVLAHRTSSCRVSPKAT